MITIVGLIIILSYLISFLPVPHVLVDNVLPNMHKRRHVLTF